MKWYYHIAGGHTHVAVFMNGGKCGDLCFRNEEFQQAMNQLDFATPYIEFIHKPKNEYPLSQVDCRP